MKGLRSKRGLAALEMIFVLPILILMLAALFEIGRMFIHYTTLNKSLQSGVRAALVEVYGTERLSDVATDDYIQTIVVYGSSISGADTILPGLSKSDVSIDKSVDDYLSVSASYDYTPVFSSSMPISGEPFSVTMTASSTMRTAP
ncbi:hypothetical protein BCS96_02335 [Vibrio breoganii]|uniref:TadE/TadG family type IV pilus assembly protein n=1 Tax=Vibrio breoganii TaxID=553239 RepID=UPI000C834658|nr:TadE/TadG family type IV pilus assembly protein [Vibrio breoganii]PMG37199.1 hypothetical protein BCU93_15665 [Vibrio breoganii]PML84475.1 hypothetical protein BCT68_08310 [Vibrio breoganii]PMM48768.1 hypothetical protein BCT52_04010 [Vibrio breoganii]PMM84344.1 hypothetical protein BCT45_09735 [Vibrio breoganii]PMO90205.1 hypothetical protein BCS98_02375 [Vibrio breoganii]